MSTLDREISVHREHRNVFAAMDGDSGDSRRSSIRKRRRDPRTVRAVGSSQNLTTTDDDARAEVALVTTDENDVGEL